jgi:TolB-like protein
VNRGESPVTQSRSAPLTISVLPFKTAADDAVSIRFAGGITADLADDLSRLSEIWVINDPGGSGDLHHEKRARYLVSGSVFHEQGRLLVHVRLTESATARQLWSEHFDHPLGELFDMQSEISRRVVDQLSLRVSQAERRHLARRYTRNLAAYGYFLDAQAHLLTRKAEDNRQARALYRLAIEQGPAFAQAYADLALSHAADYRNQWSEDGGASLSRAREMADTALHIDPEIPQTYWVLGYVDAQRRQHQQALESLRKAVALDNSFADTYALMGGIHTYLGTPKRSLSLLCRAMRLRPEAGYLYFLLLGRAYYFLGDIEQARINLHEALSRNPASLDAHLYMAASAVTSEEDGSGEWEAEEVRMIRPGFSFQRWLQTYPMTSADQIEQLRAALAAVGLR